MVTDEIKNILEFQDVALNLIETNLNAKIEEHSRILMEQYFSVTDQIESIDLNRAREDLNLNPDLFDIYIINQQGIIVNTTLESDLNRALYAYDGMEEKLAPLFENKGSLNDRFATELSTRQLKKYSYHATSDGQYIVELGMYSKEAFGISEKFKNRLTTITEETNIMSIDLFINPTKPMSKLYSNVAITDTNHINMVQKVLETTKTYITFRKEEGRNVKYAYVYLNMGDSETKDQAAVIQIISDVTDAKILIRNTVLSTLLLLILTIGVMIGFFYKKIGRITLPILHLVQKAIKITEGNLEERVEVVGDNEVTTLSEQFNIMVEKLERSYFEIVEQKKDLEDSIRYAKRIQNAILPPEKIRNRILPDSFVMYKPKDIVSGDFYWLEEKNGKALFSVVDCTGHGVPGAFMSIVGYNGLNRAVGDHNLTAPGEILDDLNDAVTRTLRQKTMETV